jgi:hypothetical protein
MNMLNVEGIDMVEEQYHPMNHQFGKDDMNMVGNNMVKVDGIYTVVEYFYPINH